MLIISKDSGIIVHPSPNTKTVTIVDILLNLYPKISTVGENSRPGIVHRLDKGTSGLMVIAKNNLILNSLKDQFKKREVVKEYLAVVNGNTKEKGIINAANEKGFSVSNNSKYFISLNKIKYYSEDISDINELYSFKKELLEDLIILPIRNDDNTKKSLVNFTPLTAQNFNKNKVFPYKSTWITPRFDV